MRRRRLRHRRARQGLRFCAKAWLLPVKVFHADALATESRVADAIRYATRFADILSCSWRGPESPDIEAALEEAGGGRGGKGCPVFVATGNEGANFVKYPARSPHAIAVGASTNKEKRADYSNFGPEVSIIAPSSGGTKAIFTTDVSLRNRGLNWDARRPAAPTGFTPTLSAGPRRRRRSRPVSRC